MALNQTVFQLSIVFGSLLAGLVIARWSIAVAYWIDVASFAAAFVAVWRMRTPPRVPTPRQPVVRSLVDGLLYLSVTPILLATMDITFLTIAFVSPVALH